MSNPPNGTFASTSPCTCPPIVTRTTSVTVIYTMTDESGSVSTTTTTTTSTVHQDRELSEDTSTPVVQEDPTSLALLSDTVAEKPTAPAVIESQPVPVLNTTIPAVETPAPVPIAEKPSEPEPEPQLTTTPEAAPVPESSSVVVPEPESSNVEVPATPESSVIAIPDPVPETSSVVEQVPTSTLIPTEVQPPAATIEPTFSSISNSTTSVSFLTPSSTPIDTPVFAVPVTESENEPEPTQAPAPTTKEAVETTQQTTEQAASSTSEATSSEKNDEPTAVVPVNGGVSSAIDSTSAVISATQTAEDEIEMTTTAEFSQVESSTTEVVFSSDVLFGEPTRLPQQSLTMTTLLRDTTPTQAIGGGSGPVGEHVGSSGGTEAPTSSSDQNGSAENSSDPNLQVVGHDSDSNTPSTPVLVGSVVGALTGVAMIAFLFWMWRRKTVKRGRRESLLTPLSLPPEGGNREKSAFPRFHGTPSPRSPQRPVITVLRHEDNQYDQDNQVVRLSTGSNPFLDGHAALNREPTVPVIPPKSPRRNPFADSNTSNETIPPPALPSPAYPYAPAPYVTNLEASGQYHPNLEVSAPYVTNLEAPPKRRSGPARPKTRPPSINTNANFRVIYRTPSQEARSFEQHRKNIRSDQFDLEPENGHVSNGSHNIYPMPLNVPSAYPPPPSHSDRVSWDDGSSSIYSTDVSVIVGWEGEDPALDGVPPTLKPGPPGVYQTVEQLRNGEKETSPKVGKAW